MDYELAKQLKEAGFPQEKRQGAFIAHPSAYSENGETVNLMTAVLEGGVAYSPTLEELIEACGKDFIQFELADIDRGKWCAQGGWNETYSHSIGRCRTPKYDKYGSTPTEAVARLWLALQPIIGKGDTSKAAVRDLWRKQRSRSHANGDASA